MDTQRGDAWTLRCEGLEKSYDGVRALENVTLHFSAPGVVGIIGPNGAGKTTLLHVLSGFVSADAGRCFLGDREITLLPAYRISTLGIARTFQDLRLVRRLTAIENVLLARPHQCGEHALRALLGYGVRAEERRNREIALHHLRDVGLEAMALELAENLSYGQQKLLTLACCLATDARVLLLDEPVAGVHPELASQILELLKEFQRAEKLVVFIEHDLDAVKQIADHVLVMDHGKVVMQGDVDDVMKRPEIIEAYVA